MSDTTVDGTTELEELEARMARLVSARHRLIDYHQRAITLANEHFDRKALPLGHRINELRARLPVRTEQSERRAERAKRTPKLPSMRGLTEAEQEHFLKLLGRKG